MKGKISISAPFGSDCDYINIEVVDELSGTEFVEIHVKYADFAQALTGRGRIDCDFELRAAHVGKTREIKTESVFVSKFGNNQASATRDALKPFEVDGWTGYDQDAMNHHRCTGYTKDGAYYTVTFTRFV